MISRLERSEAQKTLDLKKKVSVCANISKPREQIININFVQRAT